MNIGITYKDSGVDVEAGNESVRRIKRHVQSTFNKSVLTGLGTFGALYDLGEIVKNYKNPVLVQSIDGVGTKLMIANAMGMHTTIGIDMVAHSCNDILCQGAKPITFLDYIATEKVRPEHIEDILKGIAEGCREAGMPVIGGEIAEMPGVYVSGEYDLVGSVTGVVEKDKIIIGDKIKKGDILIGIASSGLHTNGYSLARKVLFTHKGYTVKTHIDELGMTLGEALLKPHRNYSKIIHSLMDGSKIEIKGIAHITGGGFIDNIPRILPDNCTAVIKKGSWEILPIFKIIQREGNVPDEDMFRTLNMGIGLVIVVSGKDVESAIIHLNKNGFKSWEIGVIEEGEKGAKII
ncbi:MAG: phosphoribosylformylglycinamidine cyclo-ligase [Nitrospinae bacterium RIFCSPLOWO2_02_39_17]|nr:MAG: phosphoribosylformylglycinamidine cyclo-ligase [Nitrospinae bacterium RIFCSPHIGHO2_02_39_11]OGW06777.1 MAG: phosphoribosylformylglycinamidine cyclo-ligase [Nitrospinae bacterium RIFCSPLOWO2_02_39_17]